MGLLDFASDPQGMQGLALLAAAGPSMQPMNFASRLGLAGTTYQGLLGDQLKQQLTKAQLSEYDTKNQLQQFQLKRLQDWQSLVNGGGGAGAPAPAAAPGSITSPGAFLTPVDGMGPTLPVSDAPASMTRAPASGFQFGLRGMPDANSRAVAASMTPDEYMKIYATQAAPQTDIEKLLAAQGVQPGSPVWQQAIGNQVAKLNSMPPVPLRTPLYWDPASNSTKVVPPDQLKAAYGGQAEAGARGKGNIATQQVWDPTANDGKGGMVFRTESQVADAATGNSAPSAPAGATAAPIRSNNPGALSPGGKLAQFQTPEQGLAAMDANLSAYGKKGVNTLQGVISTWAPQSAGNDTASYVKDVSQRLGIAPNQPIDLSNPLQRHALSTAIMLHENGPAGVFSTPQQPASATPMLAQPPLGQPERTKSAQQGGADAMKASYTGLQAARANGQAALDNINHMLTLGQQKSFASGGVIGDSILPNIPFFGTNAKEYEKDRDNLVTMLSGNAGMNTDAARALVYGSVPNYGAPKDAIVHGLQIVANQVQQRMLKANLLTPYFNKGDADTYNSLENGFDQAVKPTLMPAISRILSMPAGPARAQALKGAATMSPQLKQALEVLAQGGAFQ